MIIIQKPTKEDVHGIQEVHYRTWLSTYPNEEIGVTKEDIEERFKNRFSKKTMERRSNFFVNTPDNVLALIAKDDNKIVGMFSFAEEPAHNVLQGVYILPDYQGKGIFRKFWDEAQKFMDHSKDTILHVVSYNKKTIDVYKKLGFIESGKITTGENSPVMPISGVVMPEIEMILKHDK